MMIPKFRVWDKKTERMWDIETWHIADEYFDLIEPGKSIADINAERFWRKQSEIILMQSTGLKDNNGVEIYVGDIVRSNWYDCDNNAYRKKGEVIFVGAQFVIAYDSQFDLETGEIEYDAHSLSYAENPEIIGNIYENSDLLEVAD